MMRSAGYRIVDEPRPGGMARVAVDPLWPLFGYMFGGIWLSWLWFAVNSHALGSPTRKQELLLIAGGIGGVGALAVLLGWSMQAGWLSRGDAWWGLLAMTLWKLGVSYWLFAIQRRTFDLYEYFGGRVINGVWVVAAGYFLRPAVAGLVPHGLWALMVF
jgi:hypothetical protein